MPPEGRAMRYFSLDKNTSRAPGCHRMLQWAEEVAAGTVAAGLAGAEETRRQLEAFAGGFGGVWAKDRGHIVHLQNKAEPDSEP